MVKVSRMNTVSIHDLDFGQSLYSPTQYIWSDSMPKSFDCCSLQNFSNEIKPSTNDIVISFEFSY